MLKIAYADSCAAAKWSEENHTITALIPGLRCTYEIKCQICERKRSGQFSLLSTLISKWKELKPCHH